MSSTPRFLASLLCLLIAGCLNQSSPPSNVPTNFTVTPGESRVILTWDNQPGQTYWAFYKMGSTVSIDDPNISVATGLTSPAVISGLINGTQYAFMLNAHTGLSKGGPPTAVVTTTPRLLGPTVPWTIGAQLTAQNLRGIAFGNNYYVAVGDGGSVYTAAYLNTAVGAITDWIQPTTLPTSASNNLVSVIYDGARFLALSADGTIVRSYSNADVANWVISGPILNAPPMSAVAYGAGIYVAVGAGGAIETNTTSGATGTWSAQTSGTSQDLYGVSYLNGRFVAVGAAGTLLTSTDGIHWTPQVTNTNNALRSVAYGTSINVPSAYVAVGDAGTIVSSADAATWTTETTIPSPQSFYGICFGPDRQFIAIGTNGAVAYSLTGADGTWSVGNAGSVDLYGIAPATVFTAVGAVGTNVSGN